MIRQRTPLWKNGQANIARLSSSRIKIINMLNINYTKYSSMEINISNRGQRITTKHVGHAFGVFKFLFDLLGLLRIANGLLQDY